MIGAEAPTKASLRATPSTLDATQLRSAFVTQRDDAFAPIDPGGDADEPALLEQRQRARECRLVDPEEPAQPSVRARSLAGDRLEQAELRDAHVLGPPGLALVQRRDQAGRSSEVGAKARKRADDGIALSAGAADMATARDAPAMTRA